jgi:hypothetical protein
VSNFRHSLWTQEEFRLRCRLLRTLVGPNFCPLALGFLLLICWPIQVAADNDDVYLLEQLVSALGPTKVFISKNAIHFMCINLGYEAVCRAPTWQVVVFNPKAKVYIKRTLPQLIISGFIPGKWSAPSLLRPESIGSGQFSGHQYIKYKDTEVHNKTEHHTDNSLTGLDLGQRSVAWEQWNIDDFPFDSHVGESLAIMTHSRLGYGIAIANYSIFAKGAQGYNLKTTAMRKATLVEAGLDYPLLHDYKEIGNVQELCFANKKKELSSFFEDMGVGEEFGGKTKPGPAQPGAQGKK